MQRFVLLYVFILYSLAFPQEVTKLNVKFSFATSLSVNPNGNIFVSDAESNEVIKLDTLGNILKTIGGFGSDEYSLNYPTQVFANVLNVFVADKNNNRIQIYDKDLNFLSKFSSSNESNDKFIFRYPTSVATNNQGEMFILDSDNQRVLKYNLRGEFITEIGGNDAGKFKLKNPLKICVDSNYNLCVLDEGLIIVFDQFGNGKTKISLTQNATNFNINYGWLIVSSDSSLSITKNLSSTEFNQQLEFLDFNLNEIIVDAAFYKSKLYILTASSIYTSQLTNLNK